MLDLQTKQQASSNAQTSQYSTLDMIAVTRYMEMLYTKDNVSRVFALRNTLKKNKESGKGIQDADTLKRFWNALNNKKRLLGSQGHTFLELYHYSSLYNEEYYATSPVEIIARNAYKLLKDKGINVLEVEVAKESEDYKLKMVLDALCDYKGTQKLIDWKFIDKNKTKGKLKDIFSDVPNNPMNIAFIQLAIYDIVGGYNLGAENLIVVQIPSTGDCILHTINSKSNPLYNSYPLVQRLLNDRADYVSVMTGRKRKSILSTEDLQTQKLLNSIL